MTIYVQVLHLFYHLHSAVKPAPYIFFYFKYFISSNTSILFIIIFEGVYFLFLHCDFMCFA